MNGTQRTLLILALVVLLIVPTSAHHQPGHSPPGQSPGEEVPQPPHPAEACSQPYHVHGAGWDLCWQLDDLRVQGLEINRAYFHNESVIWKMGVPFTLTKYERPTGPGPFKDVLGRPGDASVPGFGQGSMEIDESACPRFHAEGTLLADGRLCVEHRPGVNPAIALWARWDLYNYRFMQGYHFDSRGEIEPFLSLGGHLFDGTHIGADGQNHYHHIYWRVDFDVASPGDDVFQLFKRVDGELISVNLNRNWQELIDSLTGMVQVGTCDRVGGLTGTLWCDVTHEGKLTHQKETYDKWRVVNKEDRNALDRAKSFEFVVHSDTPANDFSTFDVMVLQHQGDSEELGYEVPGGPTRGDERLNDYMTPPEAVTDPVVWIVHHNYHDTRDEDRRSMTYHDAGFKLRPMNFLDENPGEDTHP